jgi:hypothetical protein
MEIDISHIINENYSLMTLIKERTIYKYNPPEGIVFSETKMEKKDITYTIMALHNLISNLHVIANAISKDDTGEYYQIFEYEASKMDFSYEEYIQNMGRFIKSAISFIHFLS